MSHWEWLRWNNERHAMRAEWERFFESYDLLLCPAAATTAFPHNPHGERWERMLRVNGADQPSTTQMLWAGYSGMVFLPSTVAPIGHADDGLPVGVQIVGPQYGDLTCIRFAQLLEREYWRFEPPPGFSEPPLRREARAQAQAVIRAVDSLNFRIESNGSAAFTAGEFKKPEDSTATVCLHSIVTEDPTL